MSIIKAHADKAHDAVEALRIMGENRDAEIERLRGRVLSQYRGDKDTIDGLRRHLNEAIRDRNWLQDQLVERASELKETKVKLKKTEEKAAATIANLRSLVEGLKEARDDLAAKVNSLVEEARTAKKNVQTLKAQLENERQDRWEVSQVSAAAEHQARRKVVDLKNALRVITDRLRYFDARPSFLDNIDVDKLLDD